LIAQIDQEILAYNAAFQHIHLKEALRIAIGISQLGNKYVQDNKPWELLNHLERCGTVVGTACDVAILLATLLEPFLPTFSDKVLEQSRFPPQQIPDSFKPYFEAGHELGVVEPIFRRLGEEEIAALQEKFGGKKDNIFPADVRTGRVVGVSAHPEADRLYVLQVDLGKEKRQIVSGLRDFYEHSGDENNHILLGKNVVVLCNIKASKLKGVQSQGMILTAEHDVGGHLSVGVLGTTIAQPGTQVLPQGFALESKAKYDTKEFAKLGLQLNGAGVAVLGGVPLVAVNARHPDGSPDFLVADKGILSGLVK